MDDTVSVICPCCGEASEIALESVDSRQEFTQDCPVCCRPWKVRVTISPDGEASAQVEAES